MKYELHVISATTQYPSGNTDAHNYKEKKSRYYVLILVPVAQTIQGLHKWHMQEGKNA
jgi:cbb3-type cytochrome oxidase subunit 1